MMRQTMREMTKATSPPPTGTGTFGRVCLCRERDSRSYKALKIMAMADVIRLKQVEHVRNEKSILLSVRHPFVVEL